MKRCKDCRELMEAPLEWGSALKDRMYECLECGLFWDGKEWLTPEQVQLLEKKLEGKSKTNSGKKEVNNK